jgi:antitoxin ParD1/3/4
MSISLTPEQERFIQTKLQAGKYHSVEEILEIALRLLDEYDYPKGGTASQRSESEWAEEVRTKIDAAIEVSNSTPPVDGEPFVNKILERFQQTKQA